MVSADMCGSVWKVLVEPGQQVEAGAPLLVVEAMKMELAVIAPVSGTVQSVRCQPGKAVTPGDALLLMKPTEAA
ncbi:Biotin/lipoyl attachment protein [compost metagenome]